MLTYTPDFINIPTSYYYKAYNNRFLLLIEATIIAIANGLKGNELKFTKHSKKDIQIYYYISYGKYLF
jgi:hypothetical protein